MYLVTVVSPLPSKLTSITPRGRCLPRDPTSGLGTAFSRLQPPSRTRSGVQYHPEGKRVFDGGSWRSGELVVLMVSLLLAIDVGR